MDQITKGINNFTAQINSGKVKYEDLDSLAKKELKDCVDSREKKDVISLKDYYKEDSKRLLEIYVKESYRKYYNA